MLKKQYLEFVQFCHDIDVTFNDDSDDLQKFLFDFLLRLIVTFWDDLEERDKYSVISIAKSQYSFSQTEISQLVVSLKNELPKFSILENSQYSECKRSIALLEELTTCYEPGNSYTFDDTITELPGDLNFPSAHCMILLNNMGYKRENYKTYQIEVYTED